MTRTYLSIDLDYFLVSKSIREMINFFNKIIKLNKPIYLVRDHQNLLPDIDQCDFDKLVNVDYHSDITNAIDFDRTPYTYEYLHGEIRLIEKEVLLCGNWVNFVKNREVMDYGWIKPADTCFGFYVGQCFDFDASIKNGREFSNRFWRDPLLHNWRNISHSTGINHINFEDVVSIGISVSPEWTELELEEPFIQYVVPELAKVGAVMDQEFLDRYENYLKWGIDNFD